MRKKSYFKRLVEINICIKQIKLICMVIFLKDYFLLGLFIA